MTASEHTLAPQRNRTLFFSLLALVIPGSSQFLMGRRWRGALLFLSIPVLGYIVYWAQSYQKVGLVTIGSWTTSWLWAPLALFWIWNVFDARRLGNGQESNSFLGLLLVLVILYVVAWNVTQIKPERLVTRFNDAKSVATNLVNPDVITITINGEDRICAWQCMSEYISDTLAGRPTQGPIRASKTLLDIIGRVEQVKAPAWEVKLGLAQSGGQVTGFVAGSLIETIAMGLMATIFSTILAIPVSFLAAHNIMSRVPGGNVVYYITRTLLNIVRAVDPVVWGLLIIVWVGLGSFAGVIALTIHSLAALAKLFSEEIEHIDPGPVEAVTASGANLIQTLRYAVVPQITPPFLAYTLLRWDINMRAATVVGFVAGGGIGFFVVETIRMGGYQLYATALWSVAVVIILVDAISSTWRARILADQPSEPEKRRSTWVKIRTAFLVLLGVLAFIYCWNISEISIKDLFAPAPTLGSILHDFVTIDLGPKTLGPVVQQMLITIFQAMLATTLGAIIALPFSFLAARNLTGRSKLSVWIFYLTRGLFNVLRSIEALLYAAIFVFWVGIGPFAGMMALAVTTFGLIGKLFSEAIEEIDPGPIEAVTATGASPLQVINYAILPQIVPPFTSYLIYQWDINVRMATIIGFAGGGGIGLMLNTFFGLLQYHKAGTVVLFIVVVVALMDFASAKLRQVLV
ncbi:MAG: phosphonate ABC transporter, permease protein PhnE [Chloroflexi bacterium]|nr:phosphonate ABC transporter, permease protein PhnE [Chloroflexota bacterium]